MGIAYSLTTLSSIQLAPPGGEGQHRRPGTQGIALGTGIAGAVVAIAAVPLGLAPTIALAELQMIVLCGFTISASGRLPATTACGGLKPISVSDNLR
jgi:hypothetical protein